MQKYKLSEEVARAQLDLFEEYYDVDAEDFSEDLVDTYKAVERKLLKAIRKGKLEIKEEEDKLILEQHLRNGETVRYGVLTGQVKIAMDRKDDLSKAYALLGALCGQGSGLIRKFVGADLSIAEHIGTLFLFV